MSGNLLKLPILLFISQKPLGGLMDIAFPFLIPTQDVVEGPGSSARVAEILKRNPSLRVEVAGHTDLCGKDAYNQKLSERRAKAVYDFLTSNGVDAGRLAGPVGYGESRPLENTPQTLPGCKSEKNRRTELNAQN